MSEKKTISIALMLSAASALIYEIAATKYLFLYFVESSYSIATVLSVFLFGLGIGSYIIYRFEPKESHVRLLFGILQLGVAIYASSVLSNLNSIISTISELGTFAVSVVLLVIPAIFLGAVFPLANLKFPSRKNTVGLVYSIDLLGAILGSMAAGFILIPQVGIQRSVFVASLLNVIAATFVLPRTKKLYALFAIIIVELFFLQAATKPHATNTHKKDMLTFLKNSPFGEVRVQDSTLYINNMEQCSIKYSPETSERKMAEYAIEPLKDRYTSMQILNIGLGCGLTIKSALEYPETHVDIVEINPAVVEANKTISDVLSHERTDLTVDDGLRYLRNNKKTYHSILIDIEDPRVTHSLPLYTVEAFTIISNSLAADGNLALWNYEDMAPQVRHSDRYFDILYYSLKEAFPHVYQYPGVFLASKSKLELPEYVPSTPKVLNTLDKNTLTDAAFESGVVKK